MDIAVLGRNSLFALLVCWTGPVLASPWAEVGDNQLRSDIALLAASGIVGDVTTQWPLPWDAIVSDIKAGSLDLQPASVRAAAERVLRKAQAGTKPGVGASLYLDATNKPSVVYGFDGMGRGDGSAQFSLSYDSETPPAACRWAR